jgi:biotin carboxyl carrier protein
MKWISKDESTGPEVALPDQLTAGVWSPAEVGSQKLEIYWEPSLRTLFVRSSPKHPEVPLKYRSVKTQRFPGELFAEVLLEYVGGSQGFTRIIQSEVGIQVAGMNSRKARAVRGGEVIRSPMVGKVLKVLVEPGQAIERGHEVLVIEAMKMENKIFSRSAGTVKDVQIVAGTQVSVGQVLLQIDSL